MIKYIASLTDIVLEEIPNKITLAVEISNCQGNCIGCHSPFLREDIGEELCLDKLRALLNANFGVNCILFLGEGNDYQALTSLARSCRTAFSPQIELALFSGRTSVEDELFDLFDYIKVGPFIAERGPLNNPNTNQRIYYHRKDITANFWR